VCNLYISVTLISNYGRYDRMVCGVS